MPALCRIVAKDEDVNEARGIGVFLPGLVAQRAGLVRAHVGDELVDCGETPRQRLDADLVARELANLVTSFRICHGALLGKTLATTTACRRGTSRAGGRRAPRAARAGWNGGSVTD